MRALTLLVLLALLGSVRTGRAAAGLDSEFDAANKLYAQSKFAEAATAYEKIIQTGEISPALYFNLGNACFKAGQLGHAIAAYREAEEISPRDPDVRANLQFARQRVAGPKLTESWWERGLGTLTITEWMSLATLTIWTTLSLLVIGQLKPAVAPGLRPWVWVAVVCSLVVIAATKLATMQTAAHRVAIVAVPEAAVRNGPFDESPTAFTAQDGAELRTLDSKDGWWQVTDGTSRIGWVKQEALVWSPRAPS